MSSANPYASHLGESNAENVIATTGNELAHALRALGLRAEEPRAPGKWNARQIICHLADCELVFAFRLRQTLAEEGHVIQPFDQDAWARQYDSYSAEDGLALFRALRAWNLALLKRVTPQQRGRKVSHPERGHMTFQTIVETMAGHDLNHRKQLEELVARVK